MTTTTSTSVHQTILQQLGGSRFIAMTGSKNFSYDPKNPNYLQMRLTRNKAKAQFLKITLNVFDTYTMTFSKVVGEKFSERLVTVKEIENVYCDQLQEVFTSVTGLYTKF